ncbi:hypothetical protein OGAPHI_000933 [Ogataea philodendri]|uniref:Uncharacterized protein n=1 Tax=Ogataea philodendri TaxID=1378263 RepID=A0A9P8PDT6_9ASCO|nr:uncharacterized protein OGAPHI_000933 [Ogataea philodendri]KAH3670418.1 hypothetical protein OGAPHI_000933 [Ogataea philodendri]
MEVDVPVDWVIVFGLVQVIVPGVAFETLKRSLARIVLAARRLVAPGEVEVERVVDVDPKTRSVFGARRLPNRHVLLVCGKQKAVQLLFCVCVHSDDVLVVVLGQVDGPVVGMERRVVSGFRLDVGRVVYQGQELGVQRGLGKQRELREAPAECPGAAGQQAENKISDLLFESLGGVCVWLSDLFEQTEGGKGQEGHDGEDDGPVEVVHVEERVREPALGGNHSVQKEPVPVGQQKRCDQGLFFRDRPGVHEEEIVCEQRCERHGVDQQVQPQWDTGALEDQVSTNEPEPPVDERDDKFDGNGHGVDELARVREGRDLKQLVDRI